MKTTFTQLLLELEATHDITILYACESGSRGWEFPSPDSDYDLRFIFMRPQSDYLAVSTPADTIALPVTAELDVYGWDLRKVLTLMMKSNVTPFEWLQSPIVYMEQPGFRDALWALCQQYFNPRSNAFHYIGIARGAMESLSGSRIGIKKLFYVLRPLLAAAWNMSRMEIAPMRLPELAAMLPAEVRPEVEALVHRKAPLNEAEEVTLSNALHTYINTQFDTLQEAAAAMHAHRSFDIAPLNHFFRTTLGNHDYTGSQRPQAYPA